MTEVEEMLSRIRAEQGRAFDMRHLTTSCVANVIISMLFGRRFDHTDRRLQQMITDVYEINGLDVFVRTGNLSSTTDFAVLQKDGIRDDPHTRKIN